MLFDAGCEYHGYVSDVTRTWPVSGQFTAGQRELYEAVLRVKQASIKVCCRMCVCMCTSMCVDVYLSMCVHVCVVWLGLGLCVHS